MTISERIEAARRERRVLTRVSRAGWRLEQAERERTWTLVVGSIGVPGGEDRTVIFPLVRGSVVLVGLAFGGFLHRVQAEVR